MSAQVEKCPDHKTILLICSTCEDAVCQTCATSIHQGHEFSSLSDFQSVKKERIIKYIKEGNEQIKCEGILNARIEDNIKKSKGDKNNISEQLREKRKNLEKTLKMFITSVTYEQITRSQSKYASIQDALELNESSKLEDLKIRYEKMINNDAILDFLTARKEIIHLQDRFQCLTNRSQNAAANQLKLHIKDSNVDNLKQKLQKVFGVLKSADNDPSSQLLLYENTFQMGKNINFVYSLISTPEGDVYALTDSGIASRYTLQGDIVNTIKIDGEDISNMDIVSTEPVTFCLATEEDSLYLLVNNELYPYTDANNVIALCRGVKGRSIVTTLENSSKEDVRFILKELDEKAEIVEQMSSQDKDFVMEPLSIHRNPVTEELVFINIVPSYLTILSKDMKNVTYSINCRSTNEVEDLTKTSRIKRRRKVDSDIQAIAFDNAGRILISNAKLNQILLLDNSGQFLRTMCQCVSAPTSLEVSIANGVMKLWSAQEKGKIVIHTLKT